MILKKENTTAWWMVGLITLAVSGMLFFSCSDDASSSTDVTPRNLFAGVADGKDFKTTGMLSLKDTSDIFIMIGRMLGNHTVLAAFNGREEQEYSVVDEGPLAALSEYLNELIADSMMIDTAVLQEFFTDSAQIISPGSSYIFYGIGEDLYFSNRGNITLSTFDGTINRIYGTLEAEFINAVDGPKYINAYFEDVFYLDCATLENCSQ